MAWPGCECCHPNEDAGAWQPQADKSVFLKKLVLQFRDVAAVLEDPVQHSRQVGEAFVQVFGLPGGLADNDVLKRLASGAVCRKFVGDLLDVVDQVPIGLSHHSANKAPCVVADDPGLVFGELDCVQVDWDWQESCENLDHVAEGCRVAVRIPHDFCLFDESRKAAEGHAVDAAVSLVVVDGAPEVFKGGKTAGSWRLEAGTPKSCNLAAVQEGLLSGSAFTECHQRGVRPPVRVHHSGEPTGEIDFPLVHRILQLRPGGPGRSGRHMGHG